MKFKPNTLVRFDPEFTEADSPASKKAFLYLYPFEDQEVVLYLGEIEKMSGHCIVAKKDGRVLWGYDTDWFTPVPDDEI